ncbi:MAG: patatin-like phospholipase family protein [Myxococcales bacterium]|nr:patatin-like phospholipase family protein [Myxococcales bacterium]
MAQRNLSLTFAGGGNRAFYQLGLLNRWGPRLLPRTAAVAACSAGACVVATYLSGRAEATHAFWRERRAHVTRNLDLSKLLKGQRPAPHAEVYRDTIEFAAADGGLERIRQQPFPIYVLTARLPRWLPAGPAVALGLGAYNLEKRLRPRAIHPRFGRRLGFEPQAFDARECETPEQLGDLLLASAATPPFTPVGEYGGRRLLDGGMVDNAPLFLVESHPDADRHLVLLTRPYPDGVTGRAGARLYIAPTRPTPIDRWDYTRPHLLAETIALGETEAGYFDSELSTLLA